jgi:UDP-N-acetylmuramate dehydrogenase
MRFPDDFRDVLERDVPLERYSAVRLGGPAEYLYTASHGEAALIALVTAAWEAGVPVRVLGGGANVLISDHGVAGLVVLQHMDAVQFHADGATAEAGASLVALARRCAARGLAGFEWAASVPGTVGGAVVGNAGAHGADMASNLVHVDVLEAERGLVRMSSAELAFDYRTSALKTRTDRRFVLLRAELRLAPGDPAGISAHIEANIAYRRRTQPPGASLGSIFCNPPGDYAGRLIEACGLKGAAIGGAQVSDVHANFFINRGGASAADYRALIKKVQAAVLAQTGVLLHPEVELVGRWD